jgi:hypothetical protein
LKTSDVTADKILDLAAKYSYYSGKWIIWEKWEDVDVLWRQLTRALLRGKLPNVLHIKVYLNNRLVSRRHYTAKMPFFGLLFR